MTTHLRSLLILSFHSPPNSAVGGLRWWGLSKYLVRLGWEATLLTDGRDSDTLAPEGVRVVRVARAQTLRDQYRAWRKAGESPPTAPADSSGEPSNSQPTSDSVLRKIRREAASSLSFPDEARGWLFRAYIAGCREMEVRNPSVIVSSGPPHSLHIVGALLARRAGAEHVMDYRDPWKWAAGTSRPLSDRVLQRLERSLLKRASGVVAVTPELVASLNARSGRSNVHWLTNGVDREELPMSASPAERVPEIVHVGSVYLRRNPAALVEAYWQYVTSAAPGETTARLRFIGNIEEPFRSQLMMLAKSPTSRGRVTMEPPMPRRDALNCVAKASLAIVLAQHQKTMVPAKLFESVAMGVPTLVITEAGSASAAAAGRVGAFVRDPDDVHGIALDMRRSAEGTLSPESTTLPYLHSQIAVHANEVLSRVLFQRGPV
jgi:hypothetical protein